MCIRDRISNYIGKSGEIILWLSSRFPNLYEESALKEEQEILNDKSYGRTVRKRKEKLNQAQNTAKAVNCLGWLSGIWTIFYPYPYQFAIITAIITPLLAITVVVLHKGLIRLDERKGTAFPSVLLAIVLPALGLALRALLDFNITSYAELWLPCLSISIGLFLVVLIANNEVSLKKVEDSFTGITLLIFFAVYAYGLIVTTNCYYDDSIPETYPTEILNKRIHSSKGVIYYLELAAWDNQPKKEVSVSKSFYNKMTVGDSVHIHLKKGCYEIPWFMVRKDQSHR